MEAMQLQPGGESIHALLDETTKKLFLTCGLRFVEPDILYPLVICVHYKFFQFEIPSEGTDNPIKDVIFYKKTKGKNQSPIVLMPEEVDAMVSVSIIHLCSAYDYYDYDSVVQTCAQYHL